MKIAGRLVWAVLLLAIASSAQAAGFYVKGAALFNDPRDIEIGSASSFRSSLDKSVGYTGSFGYRFSVLRAELELQNARNDFGSAVNSAGAATVSGSLKRLTGFGNAFIDLPRFFGLGPYVGGGLGYVRTDFDNLVAQQSGTRAVEFSGRDSAFAYQVAAGLGFSILGRASIHAGYRIVKQEHVTLRNAVASAAQSIKLGDDRMFELGIAIGF